MPQFPPDFQYTGYEPIDGLYVRYCLRCRVEEEAEKAYYWPKMSQLYGVLEPFLAGWKECKLRSDQALERLIGAPYSDGTYRTTLRNAPVGGLRALTKANLHDVCTKFLSRNQHLIARFEDPKAPLQPFLSPEHPEAVYFFLTEIMANQFKLNRAPQVSFDSVPHDFYMCVGGYQNQFTTSRSDPINQCLDIYIWQALAPATELDALVLKLGAIAGAKHIWRAISGFRGEWYVDETGNNDVRYSVRERYEDAVDGTNRYGAPWVDMLASSD
jgi:hypothetical protein